jgi:hypothetical protein
MRVRTVFVTASAASARRLVHRHVLAGLAASGVLAGQDAGQPHVWKAQPTASEAGVYRVAKTAGTRRDAAEQRPGRMELDEQEPGDDQRSGIEGRVFYWTSIIHGPPSQVSALPGDAGIRPSMTSCAACRRLRRIALSADTFGADDMVELKVGVDKTFMRPDQADRGGRTGQQLRRAGLPR